MAINDSYSIDSFSPGTNRGLESNYFNIYEVSEGRDGNNLSLNSRVCTVFMHIPQKISKGDPVTGNNGDK